MTFPDARDTRAVQAADAERQRLRGAGRGLLAWCLMAPLAWLGLAAGLAFFDRVADGGPAGPVEAWVAHLARPDFVAPLRTLAWRTAETLAWPLAVMAGVVLLYGLAGEFMLRRMARADRAAADAGQGSLPDHPAGWGGGGHPPPAPGEQVAAPASAGARRLAVVVLQALKVVPIAATTFAAAWAAMATLAHLDGRDHWDALPWVTPPYLAEFQSRHPGLRVDRGGHTGGAMTLRSAQGHAIDLDGSELVRAELSLQDCPARLGPAQLGGIEPYPGMACHTLARLRRADGEQWYYLFQLDRGSDTKAMEAHFRRWIDASASGSAMSTSRGRTMLSAGSRDDLWHLELRVTEGGAATLRVRKNR